MAVGFYLKNKKQEISPIVMVVAYKGRYFRKYIGESILCKKWKPNQQLVDVNLYPLGGAINKKLRLYSQAANNACSYFVEELIVPTPNEFWAEFDSNLNEKRTITPKLFLEYYDEYHYCPIKV